MFYLSKLFSNEIIKKKLISTKLFFLLNFTSLFHGKEKVQRRIKIMMGLLLSEKS